mmetsp:Transcript_13988/g.38676  ORF Transcript_13988/g.38676 Transcript_13988/m.38676 type:complete len:515 (+) Transcript_13988:308-1852(+)
MSTPFSVVNPNTKMLVRHLSGSKKWKDSYDESTEIFVQQIPKVELHVHLDGSFDPDVLYDYIQQHTPESIDSLPEQTALPWEADDSPKKLLHVKKLVEECKSKREYHSLCTCRGYRSLQHMLVCFEIFLPSVRKNLSLIEKLAFDFCQRQWEQHVVYTEVRYSPFLLAEGYQTNEHDSNEQITGEDVYKAVTSGLRRGCTKFPGIVINQILSCITWRPDWAEPTLDLVKKYQNDFPCATVGIDVAAGEEHFDAEKFPDLHKPHYDTIQKAKQLNIPITMHAGEVPIRNGLSNLKRAVDEYGAKRIGHGYRVVTSKELMKDMKEKGIHFEICPTSSVETGGWMYDNPNAFADESSDETEKSTESSTTGASEEKDWSAHPCRAMQANGLSLSLNSDDPAVFHTSLAWQYRTGLAKMGMSHFEIYQSNIDALDASFCDDEMKNLLKTKIREFAECTGLIDDLGRPSGKGPDEHNLKSQQQGYRRSLSENFKDRVYLQTKRAAAAAAASEEVEAPVYV